MVKADPKHDYYADLELPSTADSETIKRQFRLLAKQYHPDRNPGREIEVIPKFQAIQAAHEILGDAAQKKRYDADRAVENQTHSTPKTYSSTFKKPTKPPPPPPSNFPPPPKRDPNLNRPFNPRPASSASAEKFAQFARAAPSQWDRAKYEEAAKAETLRNLHNMRPQSQGPPPRVPPRAAPTAPKPNVAPSPDIPPRTEPSPGFPGLSRTNSGRRPAFSPGTPIIDEPQAPTSAYHHVHRSDRPPPQASTFSYPPDYPKGGLSTSPPTQRGRPSMSPLRTSKSSGFEDVQRPGAPRTSSRYAASSGERTDIHGPGLARSASVRNSPTGYRWDESGPFGNRPQSQQQGGFKVPPPRHHSSSPKDRPGNAGFQYSASETSSSEDEPPRPEDRRKATPRKPQAQTSNTFRSMSANDPALTGQFPKNNYKKYDDSKYQYPAPEPKANHRYFPDASNPVDDITQGLNNSGIRHVHKDDVPLKTYEAPFSRTPYVKPWALSPTASSDNFRDRLINGIPVWAIPASVYPSGSPSKRRTFASPTLVRPSEEGSPFGKLHHFLSSGNPSGQFANTYNSTSSQRPNGTISEPQSATTNANTPFSAAEWDGKFANGDNVFRPPESANRSRSPPKQPRPKLPSRNRGASRSQENDGDNSLNDENGPKIPGVRHVSGTTDGFSKAAAFQAGKFSAEDWAERLKKDTNGSTPKATQRSKPASGVSPTKQPHVRDEVEVEEHPSPLSQQAQPQTSAGGPDAMDVDPSTSQNPLAAGNPNIGRRPADNTNRHPSSSSVNLAELKETTPFKPNTGGLGDLSDLHGTLPFDSRAAKDLNLNEPPSSGPAARQLGFPPPPRPVIPPDEDRLTQESWSKYAEKMTHYMDAWNIFNCKMIDHFRTRQEQISLAMYHNWVTAVGDGASADDFDGLDFVGPDHLKNEHANGDEHMRGRPKKAGYQTYMQWLEQDRMCRSWWDVACDEHAACMEDLGRVRKLVKSIRAGESGRTGQ